MKSPRCECGRPVFVIRSSNRADRRDTRAGKLDDHDLCDKCNRAMKNRIAAARKMPKPKRAVRSTLQVLERQIWASLQEDV